MSSNSVSLDDLPAPSAPKMLGIDDLPSPAASAPHDALQVAASRAKSFGYGITDPVTAAAQWMAHLMPDKAMEAMNEFQDWGAKYGVFKPVPKFDSYGKPIHGAAAFDQLVKQDNAEVEQDRKAAGRGDGRDWFRLAGNIDSPVNLAIAAKAPVAASLAGKVASGVAQGAASGAFTPVTSGDFRSEKEKQIALGGAIGGLIPVGSAGASRVIKPVTSEEAKLLTDKGISLTPGQILGGWFKRAEDAMTSRPILGMSIRDAQKRGVQSFNEAVLNDALSPIGGKIPNGVSGKEALTYTREKLGDAYDSLLPKLKGDMSAQVGNGISFSSHLDNIKKLAKSSVELSPRQKAILADAVDNDIKSKFTKNGLASGETVKGIQSALRQKAEKYRISNDPGDQTLAGAFKELESSTRKMLDSANPKFKGELSKINEGYAYFKRAQRAGSSVSTEDGFFTPAQYHNAVKALDKSKDKRAFSEGTAIGQDLSTAAKSVLPSSVRDSGTPERLMASNPLAWLTGTMAAIPGAAMYSPLGTQVAKAALMSRPQGAEALSKLVQNSPKAIIAGAVPLAELMMSTQSPGP